MMRSAIILASVLVLCTTQAMATMTVGNIGQRNQTATTNVITTGLDCPIGSMQLEAAAYVTIADTLASTVDSATNTWGTPFDNIAGTGVGIGWNFANNTTHDLPNGGSISSTFSGTTASEVNAACVSGVITSSPLDKSAITAQGLTATSGTTLNSGTLSQATETIFAAVALSAAGGTFSCGAGFTKLSQISQIPTVVICYDIVTATSSVAFTPSWVSAANYVEDMISIKGVASLGGAGPGLMLGTP